MAEVQATPFLLRDACVICGSENLNPIVTVSDAPVFQGCVSDDDIVVRADMDWHACDRCGAAQIKTMPPLDLIYQAGHATGLGRVWDDHHAAFAEFIRARKSGSSVLEIGGGVGQLAGAARRAGLTDPWRILEPNPVTTSNAPDDVEYVVGFVEPGFVDAWGADTYVMSHVLEHFYEPAQVMAALSAALSPSAEVFLAWPLLEDWCAKAVPGALNFEHNYFASRDLVTDLFKSVGLVLVDEERFDPLATLFMKFEKRGVSADAIESGDGRGARVVADYFAGLARIAAAIDGELAKSGDRRAFITPASVYSQSLLTLGLRDSRFVAILDNAPSKQGRRLYGFGLDICAPSMLATEDGALVVLNAGAHNDEIRRQYAALNSSLGFIDVRAIAESAAVA